MNKYLRLSGGAFLVAAMACVSSVECHAGFNLGGGYNYAALYEGNGGNTLNYNNSDVTGNIGVGATGKAALNGPGTITGDFEFSAANTGQYSDSGVTVTGGVLYNQSAVQTALNNLNSLSQTLGLETGTSTTMNSGGSVNASSGTLDGSGNRVFSVTSVSFPNGTFTINGSATDYVVFNVPFSPSGFNGSITLSGGITSDHVLINLTPSTSNLTTYNNDYANLSGGPTLTISTSGLTTTATFLDPTGNFSINHSVLDGRLFGGDSVNSAIVSGATIVAPVPEPSTAAFLGFGLLSLLIARRNHKQ